MYSNGQFLRKTIPKWHYSGGSSLDTDGGSMGFCWGTPIIQVMDVQALATWGTIPGNLQTRPTGTLGRDCLENYGEDILGTLPCWKDLERLC